jgi:hypothetical protein
MKTHFRRLLTVLEFDSTFLFHPDSAAPFVYNPCGCGESCKTIEEREKRIQASTALKDPANLAKLRSICSAALQEGCFCPKGSVQHNGKCLREAECMACDDKVSEKPQRVAERDDKAEINLPGPRTRRCLVSGCVHIVLMPQRLDYPMPEDPMPVDEHHLRARFFSRRDIVDRRMLQEVCLRAPAEDRKPDLMSPNWSTQMRRRSDEQNNKWPRWLQEIHLR